MTSKVPGKQLGLPTDGWQKVSDSVPAASTVVVDSVVLADMQTVQYILSYWNVAQDKRKTMNIAVTKNSASINDTIYGKIGDILNVAVNLAIVGANMEVSMTNSEAFQVEVQLARLILK